MMENLLGEKAVRGDIAVEQQIPPLRAARSGRDDKLVETDLD